MGLVLARRKIRARSSRPRLKNGRQRRAWNRAVSIIAVERLHIDLADFTVAIWLDVKDNANRCMSLQRPLTIMWLACQLGSSVCKAVMKDAQEIFSPIREAKEVRIDLVKVCNGNTEETASSFCCPFSSYLYFWLYQRKAVGLHTWVELPSYWFEWKNCVKENSEMDLFIRMILVIFPSTRHQETLSDYTPRNGASRL